MHASLALLLTLAPGAAPPVATPDPALANRAQAVLKAHCYRCHGQDGNVEGGLNFILDRDRLVARRKIVPGEPDRSPLYVRTHKGAMPPPDERPRPTPADVETLRRWIAAGAPAPRTPPEPALLTDAAVFERVLADLDTVDRRSRRFARYFSLVPLANAGAGPDELETYRKALTKLLNSLSWHPRIVLPRAVDPAGLVLRFDLREVLWDANLWNRLLADYPYGVVHDTTVSRAVLVATASRMPVVRADWFVATASRAPLYYELLQMPTSLSELERQLRVDVTANIQQERVARAGFNGSGVSRNNRLLERHDSLTGSYWRTYDFDAVPQNLLERNILLPDRRNLFAYPLGPGLGEAGFQHAGGEAIFNLPNGLQAYILVNQNNTRIDKGPQAIVSDPRRPDRAVEAGLSCMHCHAQGIIPKDDQLRDHVLKNRKAFSRPDVDLVTALHPPAERMRALMREDAERHQKAVAKTGNRASAAEVVLAMTLRHEADVDLATLAAEVGMKPAELLPRLTGSENLARNLGALEVPGATVPRQVVAQAFGDLAKELKLGVFQPGVTGEALPDATGEADPLEAQSSPANAVSFSPDRRLAAVAASDRSVRILDLDAARDLRRLVGHTASLWAVAYSPDGTRLLSGGKDGSVRLWDAETGRELKKLDGHADLVGVVAFSPDGLRGLSAGYDHEVILWDLVAGVRASGWTLTELKYVNAAAFSPAGDRVALAAEGHVVVAEARTGKVLARLAGHGAWVTSVAWSPDGGRLLTGSDDGTARLWDVATLKELRAFRGHTGPVKAVALSPDGSQALTGGADAAVRLWDAASGKELKVFRKHADSLVSVAFSADGGRTLSGSRDAVVLPWKIGPVITRPAEVTLPPRVPTESAAEPLKPVATWATGGTVGLLSLTPDRQSLIAFNRTKGEVVRLDARSLKPWRLALDPATDATAVSHDGRTLVAVAPRGEGRTLVQVIDPLKPALVESFEVRGGVFDVAVADAGVAFLSGSAAEWADVQVVDLKKKATVATWGGVWGGSFLALTADQRRLYHSSRGVTPGTLEGLTLPTRLSDDRPASHRPAGDRLALGGEVVPSPDGRFLLCTNGTVLRSTAEKETDLTPAGRIEPFLAAAFDVERGSAYTLARDGTLRTYAYPGFAPRGRHRLALAGYRLAVDGAAGRLYVAGFDPAAVADRPRDRAHGVVQVYELKDVVGR